MPRRATIAEGCGGLPPFSETSLARAHGKTFQNGPKPSATLRKVGKIRESSTLHSLAHCSIAQRTGNARVARVSQGFSHPPGLFEEGSDAFT